MEDQATVDEILKVIKELKPQEISLKRLDEVIEESEKQLRR